MAISNDVEFLNILKNWYKDGVESLLLRDSPFLNKIKKLRVEGKTQNFSALWGHGGGVSGDFTVSKANATKVAHNAEYSVAARQLFSSYTVLAKEIQATVSRKGSYISVAADKMAAATDGFRKVMAACLYGNGYGVIGAIKDAVSTYTANTPVTIENLPTSTILKLDVDQTISFKANTADTTVIDSALITEIDESTNSITIVPQTTVAGGLPAGTLIAYAGAMDPSGNPILPEGLQDWLPIKAGRQGTDWKNYIGTAFNNVTRNRAPDRLAGSFFYDSTSTSYASDVQNLLKKVRRHGSKADIILMNDNDWQKLANEIESTNTYFTQTSGKNKKDAVVGMNKLGASFSTNYIDNIYDDPFVPEGIFYILDSDAVQFWVYTNVDKPLNTGIDSNEPGKQDVETLGSDGKDGKEGPWGLLIDNMLSITQGTDTWEGTASLVSINFFGNLVVTNAGNCGVGIFHDADTATLPGWN